jgi:hypothetical protein
MKKQIGVMLLLLIASVYFADAQNNSWSDGSARTLAKGRFETGFIHTSAHYGLTDSVELSSYLLGDIFVPSLSVKKFWISSEGFLISSSHGLFTPTPFLRFFAKEKIGGLLPPDNYIPFFLVIENYGIVSYDIYPGHTATCRIGGKIAIAIGDQTNDHPAYERLETIDYPFIFQRTAFLTKTPPFALDGGLALTGPLISDFDYSLESDVFLFGVRDNLREEDFSCWAIESSALAIWNVSNRFRCHIGMIYSYGNYPFGTNSVLYPLLDFQIAFGGKE